MRLTQYLIENRKETPLFEKHDVVLQQIVDAIDNGHINYADDKIDFDVGSLIGSPKLKGLGVAIRKGKQKGVRLGQNQNGDYVIVIDADEIPGRQDIDSFLSSKPVYAGFGKAYKQYATNHFDKDKEYDLSNTEKHLQTNNRDSFEGSYDELVKAITDHTKQYTSSVGEIDKEMQTIANMGRKSSLELAKTKLRDEYLGKSDKEFISKVLGLPQAEFAKNLDKDWKAKLESRLGSYYNSNFSK